MAKAKAKDKAGDARTRTTIVLPESLLVRLKIAAAEERTDVSALLARAADDYLKAHKGGKHGRP
jgi:CopG-like RHH_1 or ribbon-helix-helix domain, RHH_5